MPAGGTAFNGTGNLAPALDRRSLPSAPQSYSGASANLPGMPSASEQLRQRVIDAQMKRSNSAIDRQQEQVQSDLIARGIRPGTEAYAREMDTLGRQRNDAQAQAEANATGAVSAAFGQDLARRQEGYNEGITDSTTQFGQGMSLRGQAVGEQAQNFNQTGQIAQEQAALQSQGFNQSNEQRRQAIAEMIARRQIPLNEITALISGSQTGASPAATSANGAPGFNGATVAPAPVFGAQNAANQYNTDVFNQQVGQRNANIGAGASIGAAALAAGMF